MSNILLQLSKQSNGSNSVGMKPLNDVNKLTTTITNGRTVYNSGEQFYELKEMANKIIQQTNEKKVIAEEKEESIAVETNKLKEWEQTLVSLSKEKILLESVYESSVERNLKIEKLVTEAEEVVQKIKEITSFVEKQVLLGSTRYQSLTEDYLETLQNRLSLVLERKSELMSRMQTEYRSYDDAIELLQLLNSKVDQIRTDINQNHHLLSDIQRQVEELNKEEHVLKQKADMISEMKNSTRDKVCEMMCQHDTLCKFIEDEKRLFLDFSQNILDSEKRLSVVEQVGLLLEKSSIQTIADVCVVLEASIKIDQSLFSSSEIQSLYNINSSKMQLDSKLLELNKRNEMLLISLSKEESVLSQMQSDCETISINIDLKARDLAEMENANESKRKDHLELISQYRSLSLELDERKITISQIEEHKTKNITSTRKEEESINQQLFQMKLDVEKLLVEKRTLEIEQQGITRRIYELQQQISIEGQECSRLRSMLEQNQTTHKKRQEQNHKQSEEKNNKTKELMDTLSKLNLERQNLLKKGSTLASDLKNELESKQLECKLKLERKSIEKIEKRRVKQMEKYHKKQKNAIEHYTALLNAEETKFQAEFSSIQQQIKKLSDEENQTIESNSNQSQNPTPSYYTPKKRNSRKRKQLSLEPVSSNPDTIDLFQDLV